MTESTDTDTVKDIVSEPKPLWKGYLDAISCDCVISLLGTETVRHEEQEDHNHLILSLDYTLRHHETNRVCIEAKMCEYDFMYKVAAIERLESMLVATYLEVIQKEKEVYGQGKVLN